MKKGMKVVTLGFFVAVASMLMFGLNGSAYIDPSVMTYVIQAVAGVVIALGAVIGIYWRRAKKKAMEKLNIDENAGKEVETDEIIIDDKASETNTNETK